MSCRAKRDPNGTWHIQYRWTDWTGTKKKSQKRGFKTKKEAEEWYAHFILQQTSDPTMTLNDFWDLKRMDDDNVYRKMQGHWIIEMSEMMATVNAKSIEDIKSFISRQKETYKIPYETHPEDRPRQCVFVGTSNSMDFLPLDRTGNRRFAPILVHPDRVEKHILEDEKEARDYIIKALIIFHCSKWDLQRRSAKRKMKQLHGNRGSELI